MDIKLTDEQRIRVLNSKDIYNIMQQILLREDKIDQDREHFWVIGLDTKNRILFIELVSLGSINRTLAEPMEVFSLALQKRAVKIVLCHNHPSGDLTPSAADKDITDRLIQVGIIVDVQVIDHMIISTKAHLSFAEIGLLAELEKSTKYVPRYVLVERIQREATAIAKQRNTIEIAKKLKRKDIDNQTIADATGLTLEEVDALRVRKTNTK
jgi:DNA repair protein RadC